MQRAFLVDLNAVDTDEDTHVYVCRQCHSHIALLKNFVNFLTVHGTQRVASEVVNVQLDDDPTNHRQVGNRTLADVYCATCSSHLGVRYVAATLSDDLEQIIEEVWYNLQMEKLSEWNANGSVDNQKAGQLNVNGPVNNQQEGQTNANGSVVNQQEGQSNRNEPIDNQQEGQSNGSGVNQQEVQLNANGSVDNQQGGQPNGSADNQQEGQLNVDESVDNQEEGQSNADGSVDNQQDGRSNGSIDNQQDI